MTTISAGYLHTCAIRTDHAALCWGLNDEGQLGDGTTDNRSTPAAVKGIGGTGELTDATAIAVGDYHTCAIQSDGQALCWGYNGYDQLGDGTITSRSTPGAVKGVGGTGELTGVTAISAGVFHTCAIRTDGQALCWGYNGSGQLGDGTTDNRSTPVVVKSVDGTGELTGGTVIDAGDDHTCAVQSDGRALCWGLNDEGQLGDGTTDNRSLSTPVLRGSGMVPHDLTILRDGTGQGTVTSSPAGIECGTVCQARLDEDTTVTLTATAAEGSTFTGWTGACEGIDATCVVTMDQAREITARFTKDPEPGPAPDPVKPVPANPPDNNTAIFDPATGKLKIRLKCPGKFRPKCLRTIAWGVTGKKSNAKAITSKAKANNRKAGKWGYTTLKVKPKFRQQVKNMGAKAGKTLWVRIKVTYKKKKRVKVLRNGKTHRTVKQIKLIRTIHHHYRVLART